MAEEMKQLPSGVPQVNVIIVLQIIILNFFNIFHKMLILLNQEYQTHIHMTAAEKSPQITLSIK